MSAVGQAARGRYPTAVVGAAVIAVSLILVLHPAQPTTLDYFGYALRTTAWLSFSLFLLAYLARPLVTLVGWGRGLLRNRRYLGLAAAFVHTVHFGYVLTYLVAVGEPVGLELVIFGGLAFVLFWLMALTSNDASVRRLGRRWSHLHRFGLHYLWLIFMQTFLGGVLTGNPVSSLLFVAGLLALVLRIAAYLQLRRVTTDPSG